MARIQGRIPQSWLKIDSSELEADLDVTLARRQSQVMQIEVAKVDIENRKSSFREARNTACPERKRSRTKF